MKISVVVIAHNEEKNIEKCLKSLMNQTVKADEIILVAHNCTDKTVEIASRFPITIKIFNEGKGQAYSRYYGISCAQGDKILCTDGDTIVPKNWVKLLSELLDESKSMMAGTRVKFIGNLFWSFINSFNYFSFLVQDHKYSLWGPSFGFTSKMKNLVLSWLKEFPNILNQVPLSYYPDDFWLALNADIVNPIAFSRKVTVRAVSKANFWGSAHRTVMSTKDAVILEKYFKEKRISS